MDAKASPTEVSSILEQRIRGVQEEAGLAETGRVLSVGCVQSLAHVIIIYRVSKVDNVYPTGMVSPVCMA